MLKKLIDKFSKYKNQFEGCMYFVNAGSYSGDFYVCVEKLGETLILFNISKSEDRDSIISVPLANMNDGIENKVVELVERLPYNVYKEIKTLYKKHENTDSRL